MTPEDLRELIAISDARKQRAEADLAKISQREAHLRRQLQDMADQLQAGVLHAAQGASSMHALGAYQAWVDSNRRRRAAINMDLALVLAEKEECAVRLRRQLGEHDALDILHGEAKRARNRDRDARNQDRILATYMTCGKATDSAV